jgi:hypothetical protein
VQTGDCEVQKLNCYLEPAEHEFQKERVVRVTDIIKDILRRDFNAAIVVSCDFNNHISHMYRELHFLGFTNAMDPYTITHRLGGHLDQIFAEESTLPMRWSMTA